jgi:sugar-specific transcriptional regulator TrmB
MKEIMIQELAEFGFSAKQTRVYTAVACYRCITVDQISKATNIHPQDVYKILLVLERKGLILRTLNRPLTVEAIPIEEALSIMLRMEKEKSNKRLQHLNIISAEIKDVFDKIKEEKFNPLTNAFSDTKNTKVYVLSPPELKNTWGKINTALDTLEKSYDLVVPVHQGKPERSRDSNLKDLAKRGVKVRILIITDKGLDNLRFIRNMKDHMGCNVNSELRTLEIEEKMNFAITDSKEVWIRLWSPNDNMENTSLLVTDSKVILALAKREFEAMWNDPKAKKQPLREKSPEKNVFLLQ